MMMMMTVMMDKCNNRLRHFWLKCLLRQNCMRRLRDMH